MDSGTTAQLPARRQHSKVFKAQILQARGQPGASIAGIAIAQPEPEHGAALASRDQVRRADIARTYYFANSNGLTTFILFASRKS